MTVYIYSFYKTFPLTASILRYTFLESKFGISTLFELHKKISCEETRRVFFSVEKKSLGNLYSFSFFSKTLQAENFYDKIFL